MPGLRRLLPGHNTASAEPRRLLQVKDAIRHVCAGTVRGSEESGRRLVFPFDGFSILTSEPLFEGKKGVAARAAARVFKPGPDVRPY